MFENVFLCTVSKSALRSSCNTVQARSGRWRKDRDVRPDADGFCQGGRREVRDTRRRCGCLGRRSREYACHGVTSIENPLPVDQDTLFVLGSVTKTFTATAMMRLVAEGKVELDAPVRRYVPELRSQTSRPPQRNHRAEPAQPHRGLDWRMSVDTGEGDDALARMWRGWPELDLIAPPGTRTSYSQAGYNLAGRIIEKVTGLTFDRAVASLVFEPLGSHTRFYLHEEVMTRPFAVGHNPAPDGNARHRAAVEGHPRQQPRRGCRLLGRRPAALGPVPSRRRPRREWRAGPARRAAAPDAAADGCSSGQQPGRRVRHLLVPAGHRRRPLRRARGLNQRPVRRTAPRAGSGLRRWCPMCNACPDGIPCNQAIVRWALEDYLGAGRTGKPEPLSL